MSGFDALNAEIGALMVETHPRPSGNFRAGISIRFNPSCLSGAPRAKD
jgi:hypothetical protein